MHIEVLILLAGAAAWTFGAFLVGCWVETRRHREAGAKEPPTARQLAYIADLADELGSTVPSPRTRAEAATMIDDLLKERRGRGDEG
ncbi:MAG: hypothetical protein OYH76_17475 [Defluviicoccus sp.]|nr:hypothetical protein [Defluviicoccus sp.]MDE0277688.1 hypothetical protein [Defluviicoccus sp.]